jgi:hypothetical protein
MWATSLNSDTLVTLVNEFKRSRKRREVLKNVRIYSSLHNIPGELLLGIYLIETNFRPLKFRIVEYFYLMLRVFLFLVIRVPIPNLTISKFQVGIGTLLRQQGYNIDRHKMFFSPSKDQLIVILHFIFSRKEEYRTSSWWISTLYNETNDLSEHRKIRYVGLRYNGFWYYGDLLERVVNRIKQEVTI